MVECSGINGVPVFCVAIIRPPADCVLGDAADKSPVALHAKMIRREDDLLLEIALDGYPQSVKDRLSLGGALFRLVGRLRKGGCRECQSKQNQWRCSFYHND